MDFRGPDHEAHILFTFISNSDCGAGLLLPDPGAGSMLAQLIMGGVAGLLVVFKLYWEKIKSFFVKSDSNSEKNDTSQSE